MDRKPTCGDLGGFSPNSDGKSTGTYSRAGLGSEDNSYAFTKDPDVSMEEIVEGKILSMLLLE